VEATYLTNRERKTILRDDFRKRRKKMVTTRVSRFGAIDFYGKLFFLLF